MKMNWELIGNNLITGKGLREEAHSDVVLAARLPSPWGGEALGVKEAVCAGAGGSFRS